LLPCRQNTDMLLRRRSDPLRLFANVN
jgi:hypothetical protein